MYRKANKCKKSGARVEKGMGGGGGGQKVHSEFEMGNSSF